MREIIHTFYGQLLAPISSTSAVSEYKYAGKEWDALSTSYDFGARLPAQDAETGVRDVLHGCQRHGTLSQVDGSYLHIACKGKQIF